MKRLIATADVFVENYRPGAFDDLGLGYEEMSKLNPQLIYCSISAFGSTGPRREVTAYDNIIQGFSGMMAMTGYGDKPLKSGAPVVDYATGTTAAFAISTALFQREREGGKGQFIDVSMLEVAMILYSSHITSYMWNGKHPEAKGNTYPFATIGCYEASDVPMMIAASNLTQQKALWTALGREDMIKMNNNQRLDSHAEEAAVLASIIKTQTADYWEEFLNKKRVPAARIRRMEEVMADPQVAARQAIQALSDPNSQVNGLKVPVSAFKLSSSPAEVNKAPQPVGAQSEELLKELGYSEQEIANMRKQGATN
ncbi:CaiB/BaiF CoA transferase family protein [Vibrio ostreae]|nr:CaiB/BaiF CoA-transferase family protein [Vibrio ostreae]